MEDQGKRLLLAVAIAFAVIFVWDSVSRYLFPPPEPPPQESTESEPATDDEDSTKPDSEPSTQDSGDQDRTPTPARPGEPDNVVDTKLRGEEQLYTLEFPLFRAVFSSYGGALKSWQLKGEKYRDGGGEGREAHQLDIVRTGERSAWYPFAVSFADANWPEDTEWQGTQKSDTEIQFTWTYTSSGENPEALFRIVKTYTLVPDSYLLIVNIEVVNENSDQEKQALVVSLFSHQDPSEDTSTGFFSRVSSAWNSSCYIGGEREEVGIADLLEAPSKRAGRLSWGGFNHSYFLMAAAPKGDSDARMNCDSSAVGDGGTMRTDIVFPDKNIRRGASVVYGMTAYLGPKYLDTLEHIPAIAGHETAFDEAVDLGWFGFLGRPMLWLLQSFHSFLSSWGLAIIMLTVLVKLATLYWSNKSMRSMRKMGELKPQMTAIQKKYKDDKQRQQQEMMNLYKAHGVNPLAGCLPLVLQMPIWFALYSMLMAAPELYHSQFAWLNDLTDTDPYYILPIAMIVMMFLQSRLSPTTPDSTQQKVMMYGMPLMFGVFSFVWPSGLILYILTNTTLTAIHSVWLRRTSDQEKNKAPPKAGAKESAIVDMALPSEEGGRDASNDGEGGEQRPNRQGQASGASKKRGKGQRRRGGKRKRGGHSKS